MWKHNLTGWKKVFRFTFQQNLKSTGNKVFFLILFLIALASMPLLETFFPQEAAVNNTAFTGSPNIGQTENSTGGAKDNAGEASNEEASFSPVERLYFYNKTDLPIENFDRFTKEYSFFSRLQYEIGDLDFETWLEKNGNKDFDMHVTLENTEDGLSLSCAAPLMSHLETEDLTAFESSFTQYLTVERLLWAGLSEDDIASLETPVNGNVYQLDENGEPVAYDFTFNWNGGEYGMTYGILLITILLVAFSAESIAVSVLTEKSSKIIEYLLLSVRPLATIVGKTLASLCTILVQFAGFFLGLAVSCLVNGYMQKDTLAFLPASAMKQFLSTDMFAGVHLGTILIALAILLVGLLFYGVIAGICGASVSRMEEIGEAMKLYNIIYIIGAYFALAVAMTSAGGGTPVLNYIAYFLPLSAPFIAPTHLIIGKMPLWAGLGSLALLVILVLLAFLLASKIYANMLFYNGTPLKFKDFIRFAKQSKKEAK